MLLTQSARHGFILWFLQTDYREQIAELLNVKLGDSITGAFFKMPEQIVNAITVEYLDTVGIYIETGGVCNIKGHPDYYYNIQENNTLNGNNGFYFEERQKAIAYAITEANQIYNKRYDTTKRA